MSVSIATSLAQTIHHHIAYTANTGSFLASPLSHCNLFSTEYLSSFLYTYIYTYICIYI